VQGLSRREFLGGAAGVAAVAVLPASATIPSRHARLPARHAAATTPVFGSTVDLASYSSKNYLDAANTFDGFAGLPMATTIQNSGIRYRVVLYSEANDKAFKTAPEWFAYWSYYAPIVKDAGVTLAYNCGCGFKALPRAEAYFPSNPTPGELWMDFYATSFRGGSRIDTLIGQANAAGIPAGIAEWNWSAGDLIFTPMTLPWWNAYCEYIGSLGSAGKLQLGTIFWNAIGKGGRADVIDSASDPRIPGIHRVAQAF
jgi:hypothetical protein